MSRNNAESLSLVWAGNNSSWETNTATAPIIHGYSVLAVSRCGYGASSGYPFPHPEASAAAAALDLAATLGFDPSSTWVYGWSMGTSNALLCGELCCQLNHNDL